MPADRGVTEPIRVVRVIARMNLGGPAHHVSILGGGLPRDRYRSLLLTGQVKDGEESGEDLATERGADHRSLEALGPELSPVRDLRALIKLIRMMRAFRPDVVHTHTAKAGALGRLAALTLRPRPVIVHTFHGHVLSGYFGPQVTAVYRWVETVLGRRSDRLVGVSQATVDELVDLGVAPADRFEVIELGLDLSAFTAVDRTGEPRQAFRAALDLPETAVVCSWVGRFVPIKRVDVLLEAFALAHRAHPELALVLAGGGELEAELRAQADSLGIADAVRFLGYRRDLDQIAGASDIAVLSSDNEGTPVSLIESAAAGLPLVATDVGGVTEIVTPTTGRVVPAGDATAFAAALAELAADAPLRATLGRAARTHVTERWAAQRLIEDVDDLYGRLLAARR
ncbi:MAG: glycosyltransferase [Solirubrobacteraceae bacterium]|nr:glycosyltransferase [Solirubrobacteraceae bacterium]